MSLLRALTRDINRRPALPKGVVAPFVPDGPGIDAFNAWVSALSERYDVPRETILCAIIEMTDLPLDQKIELQEALKAVRDASTTQQEEGQPWP